MTAVTAGGAAGVPALATSGLSLRIGGADILDGVDLELGRREFLGVIGPNGAGKTTLLNVLSGLACPTAGSVRLGERDVSRWSPERRAAAGIGRTFQASNVFPALPVFENVRLAAQARFGGGVWPRRRARGLRTAAGTASDCVEQVGLSGRGGDRAGSLSHGDKRKLELAVLLATEPAVMLLDEPMAGVSAEDVPEMTGLIRRVHYEGDTSVVLVEHHIEVVLGMADRVAVMHHGALLACDVPDRVMADPAVQSAYLGDSL